MPIRFNFDDKRRMGSVVRDTTLKRKQGMLTAIREAAHDAADLVKREVNNDLKSAGNFGKWSEGVNVEVTEGDGHIRIVATMGDPAPPWWVVHQEGRVIQGKPLMWIPLSFADVPKGMWARDYPGGLFRVDRLAGGAPLLLSIADKQPKYSGHESVTIPKRLHIYEITEAAAKKFKTLIHERLVGA
jgi:hypothetical protein